MKKGEGVYKEKKRRSIKKKMERFCKFPPSGGQHREFTLSEFCKEIEKKQVDFIRKKYEKTKMNYVDLLLFSTYLQFRNEMRMMELRMGKYYGVREKECEEEDILLSLFPSKKELILHLKSKSSDTSANSILGIRHLFSNIDFEEDIYLDSDEEEEAEVKMYMKNKDNPMKMAMLGLFDVILQSYKKEENPHYLAIEKEWKSYYLQQMFNKYFPNYRSIQKLGFSENIKINILKYLEYPLFFRKISKSPHIDIDTILQYPDLPWKFHILTIHPNITLKDILSTSHLPWKMYLITENPNITEEDIDNNPDIKWNYEKLSSNMNISYEYIMKNQSKDWDYEKYTNRTLYQGIEMLYEKTPYRLEHMKMKMDFIRERI